MLRDETGTSILDADCVRELESNPWRIELTSRAADTIDGSLVVGAERRLVLGMSFGRDQLLGELELSSLLEAVRNLVDGLAAESVAQGRVRLSLARTEAQRYSLTFGVASAVTVDLGFEGDRFGMRMGASESAMVMEFSGEDAAYNVAMPATTLRLPLAMMVGASDCSVDPDGSTSCETSEPAGTVELSIPTLNASLSMSEDDGLDLAQLILGDAIRAELDGRPLLALDVNGAFRGGGGGGIAASTEHPRGWRLPVRVWVSGLRSRSNFGSVQSSPFGSPS